MSTLTLFHGLFPPRLIKAKGAERALPARPTPGPVLINDCMIGVNHTTLLHELWRRTENRADDHPPEE